MKDLIVTARLGKEGPAHSVTVRDFPENLDEMVDRFGEDVIFQNSKASILVTLQSFMRTKASAEPPVIGDDLQTAVDEWKPGTRQPGVSKIEKMKDTIAKMTPEQKAALLAELEAMGDEPEPEPAPAPRAAAPGNRRAPTARGQAPTPAPAPAPAAAQQPQRGRRR